MDNELTGNNIKIVPMPVATHRPPRYPSLLKVQAIAEIARFLLLLSLSSVVLLQELEIFAFNLSLLVRCHLVPSLFENAVKLVNGRLKVFNVLIGGRFI